MAAQGIIREIRRRTRVVGAFPDGHSALMLVAARLRHIASTKWGRRRYMAIAKSNSRGGSGLKTAPSHRYRKSETLVALSTD
jgi:transposase-like protein